MNITMLYENVNRLHATYVIVLTCNHIIQNQIQLNISSSKTRLDKYFSVVFRESYSAPGGSLNLN